MSAACPRGNRVPLLDGRAFFPRVLAAIEAARTGVPIATFIRFDDNAARVVAWAQPPQDPGG